MIPQRRLDLAERRRRAYVSGAPVVLPAESDTKVVGGNEVVVEATWPEGGMVQTWHPYGGHWLRGTHRDSNAAAPTQDDLVSWGQIVGEAIDKGWRLTVYGKGS